MIFKEIISMSQGQADQNAGIDLFIQLLGGFSVVVAGKPVHAEQWKSRRARNLLKLLALAPGYRLHRDQVVDALWPDSDLPAAANNLHQSLHAARLVLDPLLPGCLVLKEGFLSLRAGTVTDLAQFETLSEKFKGSQDTIAFTEALSLYRGELLPEDRYEEWTIQRREAARQSYLTLLLKMAHLYEAREEFSQGIEALQRMLAADPSHEDAHVGLMRLYAITGQRQKALRQYQILSEMLQAELDIEPGQPTIQLYEAIRTGKIIPAQAQPGRLLGGPALAFPGEGQLSGVENQNQQAASGLPDAFSPIPVMSQHPTNLPQELTSFIGREREIRELHDRIVLDRARLVTLTGSGGTGKTRLSLRVAASVQHDFNDGVWLVELAPLTDGALVIDMVAQVLGLQIFSGGSALNTLCGYLMNREVLIVLDNCEHLLAPCSSLAASLLKNCPKLQILATSREILNVPGEWTYRVPSLPVPDSQQLPPLNQLIQAEAVRLFIDRAAQAAPGFSLNEDNARDVVTICLRLDGIPLAIELAAARVRVISLNQITARLDNVFSLLMGGSRTLMPRQQTLRAAIDWSYTLLSPQERILWQRLSVFSGGWTLEAAEAVCAGEEIETDQVLNLLASLVDKSIITFMNEEVGADRYHILETLGQYSRGRLQEAGEAEKVGDRHMRYFAAICGQSERHLRGRGQIYWLDSLDRELDNLRAALAWSKDRDIEIGLKMAADLMWFWHIRSRFQEGVSWLAQLLNIEEENRGAKSPQGARAVQRARALRAVTELSDYTDYGSPQKIIQNMTESVTLLRQEGASARRELGISLMYWLYFQKSIGPYSQEREEMLAIFHQEQERFYLSEYFFQYHLDCHRRGEYLQAEHFLKESLAICREIEDFDGLSSRLVLQGEYEVRRGNYQEAKMIFTQALEYCRKVVNLAYEIRIKSCFILIEEMMGHYKEAARQLETVQTFYFEIKVNAVALDVVGWRLRIAWAEGNDASVLELVKRMEEYYSIYPKGPYIVAVYLGRTEISQNKLTQAESRLRLLFSPDEHSVLGLYMKRDLLLSWAFLLVKQEKTRPAAVLLGAIDRIYQYNHLIHPLRERKEHDEAVSYACSALGQDAFTLAWEEGKSMSLDQAIEYLKADVGSE
jgi:predicted ATPase/DNA-binding SARP family transcriptional activator